MTTGYRAFIEGVPSQVIRNQREYDKQQERSELTLRQLKQSERVLEILRPVAPLPRKLDQETIEKFMKIIPGVRPADFNDDSQEGHVLDARGYFNQQFRKQTKEYGQALFGSDVVFDRRQVFIPDAINDLTFAAVLGAPCLGCQLVYFSPEAQWYCSDYRIDGSFFATNENKLGILVSHLLIQCSQHCHPLTAKTVLKLRTPATLKGVLTTAKAMLEADSQFFTGKDGHRRLINGRFVEAEDEPSYQVFVRKAIVREPAAKLTMGNAFHRYYQFCKDNAMQPLTRSDFKDLVAEVIREEYDLGLRHDVLDERGKQTHGWLGIDCRLADASGFGQN